MQDIFFFRFLLTKNLNATCVGCFIYGCYTTVSWNSFGQWTTTTASYRVTAPHLKSAEMSTDKEPNNVAINHTDFGYSWKVFCILNRTGEINQTSGGQQGQQSWWCCSNCSSSYRHAGRALKHCLAQSTRQVIKLLPFSTPGSKLVNLNEPGLLLIC